MAFGSEHDLWAATSRYVKVGLRGAAPSGVTRTGLGETDTSIRPPASLTVVNFRISAATRDRPAGAGKVMASADRAGGVPIERGIPQRVSLGGGTVTVVWLSGAFGSLLLKDKHPASRSGSNKTIRVRRMRILPRTSGNNYCVSCATHSRISDNTAAMMTGPTNRPTRPNVSTPPRVPTRAQRNGSRVDPPIRVG
ncbi:MAG: hypothetical protein QOH05_161 [Acetobacteraceae bacterium]|nr:hypothetical protein [Acetobacteraceae bacterium]